MSDEQRNIINAVMHTLDSIAVCGRDNLDKMLGCMRALQSLVEENNGRQNDG